MLLCSQQCDIGKHKLMMDVNPQTLRTVGMSGNMNSGHHYGNQYLELINEEGEYERKEKDIQQVEIHSASCAGSEGATASVLLKIDPEEETNMRSHKQIKEEETSVNVSEGLQDYNLHIVTIKEEREEEDIQQMEILSYPYTGHCDENPVKEEVDNERGEEDILQVETHLDHAGSIDMNIDGDLQRSTNCVIGSKGVTEISQPDAQLNNTPSRPESQSNINLDKGFECFKCGECFTNISHLITHTRIHARSNANSCSECGKCFSKKSTLVNHLRIHTGEKPFACSDCGKCFSQKSDHVKHQRIHSGERPFSCSECDKMFRDRSHLNRHQKIHTGERPYSCSDCGRCFSQKSFLLSHQKIHTGEKPFACSECGKCFILKTDLVIHMRIHTGEKPFSCAECGKSFRAKSNCVKHQRTHSR
ncbi:uncharacterized protein O3C94_016829 isoform 2-T2 [Discoglossus pictus]